MALIWVQKHLKAFMGDENKVLLVGNSAGGSSVVLHMLSPLTKVQENKHEEGEEYNQENCKSKQEFTINSVQDGLWLSFAPVIEKASADAFLSRTPRQLLTEGSFHKVPLLLSLTRDEVTIWFRNHPEMMQKVAVEEWINRIIKQIYSGFSKEELGPLRHVIRGFYIYSKGFSPSNLSIGEHEELPSNGDGEKVPTKIIANLFSDIGLRVPCMEEVDLLSSYHESDLQYIFGQPLLGLSNSLRHENDSEVARLSMAVIKSFANYG
ncbi:Esterase E4 [Armadillidium vulgare]|nr:Esterase E4 [Armadillidium vulgare]